MICNDDLCITYQIENLGCYNDTARVHPEEVAEETVAQSLRSITGNKDNPRGSRRVRPFDADHEPVKVWTLLPSGFLFQSVIALESD